MRRVYTQNVIWTLALICAGLVLILISNTKYSYSNFDISMALSNIGSFLVVGAIISFFFENISKNMMFEEVFEKVIGSSSVFHSGIQEFHENSHDINYRNHIVNAKFIVTFFSYSDGFLKKYATEIDQAIKKNARVTLIFLSRDSAAISAMLSLGWEANSISPNYDYINSFSKRYENNKNVKVLFIDVIPKYSAVHIDNVMYIIGHTSSIGRSAVPAIKISPTGSLGKFYANDMRRLVDGCQKGNNGTNKEVR